MQCKEVELILEQEGLPPVPEAARAHIAACDACRSLVEDVTSIVAAAHMLPAEAEPPARVWVSLRAQLEAEGIIKTPSVQVEHDSWWEGFARFFSPRALATVAVGLLIAGAAVLQLRQPSPGNETGTQALVQPQIQHRIVGSGPFADVASTLDQEEQTLSNMHLASTSPVDLSLQQNLQTLNDFIRDCRQRLEEDPQDQLTRDYLSNAYQQKAELLSAMMDRGRSIN